jgi:hypothetical protein
VATIPPSALEELYAVPPKEFTRARNARVATLAKSGHHDVAEAVRRLRRPPTTLWAVNQLGRAARKRLDAFVDAVERLHRTQLRDPRGVGEASRQQRAALEALLEAAREQLAAVGVKATPGAIGRMSSTLQGAAVDSRLAEALRQGRLTEHLAAPGFEVFAGARPARLTVLPGGRPAARDAANSQRDAARTARRAAAREARAAQAAERARKAEERARARHERQTAAAEAAREVEALAEKLAEARKRLSRLRR